MTSSMYRTLAGWLGATALCTGLLTMPTLFAMAELQPQQLTRTGRLSLALRRPEQAYLPPRLTIGTTGELVVRGAPGTKVILLYAAELAKQPVVLPNGQTVPVALNSPHVEGTLSEKGVTTLQLPVPNEEALVSRPVYIAVLGYNADDKRDIHVLQLMDSTGRPASDNRLSIVAPDQILSNRPTVLPSMPGMDPNLMRQVQTVSELSTNKEKRERLYDEGNINRGTDLGKNSLYNAPGAAGYHVGGQ